MINAELLGKTLKHIKDMIERWNQVYWSVATDCGTTHCFGGWAVELSGITIQHDPIGGWAYIRTEDLPEGIEAITWTFRDDRVSVLSVATSILGLSEEQAAALFHHENDLEDLERIVGELIGAALEEEIESALEEGLGDLPEEETIEKSLPEEVSEPDAVEETTEVDEEVPF